MPLRYQDEPDGAFDPDNFGKLVSRHEVDDDDWDEADFGDTRDDARTLSRRIADLAERAADVRARIQDRRRHGATDRSLAGDLQLLVALEDQIVGARDALLAADAEANGFKQELHPAASMPVHDSWRDALVVDLSADDLALYDARRSGVDQRQVARELGLTQGAVSKREARIMARVQAMHIRMFGWPMPTVAKRRPGVRGKGRNKPPAL